MMMIRRGDRRTTTRRTAKSTTRRESVLAIELAGILLLLSQGQVWSFVVTPASSSVTTRTFSSPWSNVVAPSVRQKKHLHRLNLGSSSFFPDEEDEDDEDDEIDVDSLGDWRAFRRNLASQEDALSSQRSASTSSSTVTPPPPLKKRPSVSRENEEVLESQNKELAAEYKADCWAHPVAVPEVGGLVVRMPLEVEIFRNHKHSITGRKLRNKLQTKKNGAAASAKDDLAADGTEHPSEWFDLAQTLLETEMLRIAEQAAEDGQIDASSLADDKAELLQLYLDNQESWQEVCLVLDRNEATLGTGSCGSTTTTLVLNRPMALKLTENLAQLVLKGAFSIIGGSSSSSSSSGFVTSSGSVATVRLFQDDDEDEKQATTSDKEDDLLLVRFLLAFGQECAVYIGGPDDQDQPAEILHGLPEVPGAVEISPGSGIYRGGNLQAMIDGVLRGKYNALDFKFFVGKHRYDSSGSAAATETTDAESAAAAAVTANLDVLTLLGKYQPIACARSVALKQCLSLPKPLWHEVLELCGGEMRDISQLELLKRDDLRFQIVDEDDVVDVDEEVVEFVVEEGGEILLAGDDLDDLDTLFDDEEDDFFK